jgi:hypothetical protein
MNLLTSADQIARYHHDNLWQLCQKVPTHSIRMPPIFYLEGSELKTTPGRPQLNKLRVIHLLEADLNLVLGIIWSRRLLTQGEKLGSLETNSGAPATDGV